MPSFAHQRHDLRDLRRRQVRELAVVDGDVGHAAGAVARQRGAGHFAQHALRHLPQALRVARRAWLRPARTRCAPRRRRGTAPPRRSRPRSHRSAKSRANGSLQPIGRPVMAMTGRPAACSAASACQRVGRRWRRRVVSVSSMSVKHAGARARGRQHWRRARSRVVRRQACEEVCAGSRGLAQPRPATRLQSRALSEERCKTPTRGVPGSESLLATALTRTMWLVGEFRTVASLAVVRVPNRLEPDMNAVLKPNSNFPPTTSSPTCPWPPGAARKSRSPRPRCPA